MPRTARGRHLVLGLASSVAVVAAASAAGLKLNLTGSLPVGVYRAVRGAPTRGALVLVCLPPRVAAFASARGYVPRGGACQSGLVPIGKRIVAIAGDTVTVTPTGILVNGVSAPNSQGLSTDRKGRPLPQLRHGRYVVRQGTVWIASSYSRFSFDSRYFGAVETEQVLTRIRQFWTVGPE